MSRHSLGCLGVPERIGGHGDLSKQIFMKFLFLKVNSVQEACAKCFAAQILKFEILQNT